MNKQEFIDKARNVHGYKYKYPNLPDIIKYNDVINVEYNSVVYRQRVVKHITLKRCPEKNTPSKTTDQFISESISIWGNKYDYSLVDYKGSLKKVKIIYDGVIFEQVAISHLQKMSPELNVNVEYFLKKAYDKWGSKYDYSLVDFKNVKTKVKIIFDGKIYEQSPSNHLKSAPELVSVLKTNKEFIDQCNIIHNYKYDYSKTKYTLSRNKVVIICPTHGDFEQVANSHFMGSGCFKCGFLVYRNKKNQKNTEQFISEAKDVWGDKYDYSLVDYKNARTKVKIIYDDIVYEQLPTSHLKYPVEGFIDYDIFIKRAIKKWEDKYDYSLVEFTNCHNKVKIIYDGIIYEQLPLNHLTYAPEKILRKTQEEFIEQSSKYHGGKYSYDKVEYINDRIKVIIGCSKHGEFLQIPNVHLRSGCPSCNESKGEKEISKFLDKYKITYKRQHKFEDCKNQYQLPFDFYIPLMRTAIEFDGIQHYQPIDYFGGLEAYNRLKINDEIKNNYCEDNYINLIRIKYDQENIIWELLWENLKVFIKK